MIGYPYLRLNAATFGLGIADSVQHASLKVGTANLKSGALFELAEDAANAEAVLSCYHDTEATIAVLTLRKADGTEASPALVDDNAVLGTIHFDGYDGSGWHTGARIEARVQGTPSDGTDMPAELTFWTTPDGTATPLQRMTILNDGKCGLGIDNPTGFFHTVKAGATNTHYHDTYSTTNGVATALYFRKSATNVAGSAITTATNDELLNLYIHGVSGSSGFQRGVWIYAKQNGAAGATRVPTDLVLQTASDATDNNGQLVLYNTGTVGVNCPAPAGNLSIGDTTEGRTASINVQTAHETHTLTIGATSVTTTIDVPSGAMVLGASFCVNTAVTDDDGNDTWTAAFSGGDTTALGGGAPAQNTKVNTLVVPAITNAETNVTFTPNGTNFATGVIEVVVYYIDLTSLANV